MPSNLSVTKLRSQLIRKSVLGEEKTRKIGKPDQKRDKDGNIITQVFSSFWAGILEVKGFLYGGNGVGFSFSGVWSLITQAASYIYNFNWNATDEDLDKQLSNIKVRLASQLGGTLGNAFGFLVCGVAPAVGIMYFNEPLGLHLLKEVGEEALDEFLGNFKALCQSAFNAAVQWGFTQVYKNTRRAIKQYFNNPDSPQNRLMKKVFGNDFDKAVKSWGAANSKPWSFSSAVTDAIDNIKDPATQAFVEEFVDEFFDGCTEAGYVVAQGLDDWYMKEALRKQTLLGEQRIVEIYPNRESTKETIILAGPEEILKPQIVSTLATHQMIDEKNIGMFLGVPVRELLVTEVQSIQMKIVFSSEKHAKKNITTVTVSNVKREKIDWQKIKTACGGNNGYMWGNTRVRASMSDGFYLTCWGATWQGAWDIVEALAEFTHGEILLPDAMIELEKGKRKTNTALQKKPRRQYPYQFTILNQQKILNEEGGVVTKTGTYNRKEDFIPLHTDTKPDDFNEIIAELFRIPGQNN